MYTNRTYFTVNIQQFQNHLRRRSEEEIGEWRATQRDRTEKERSTHTLSTN